MAMAMSPVRPSASIWRAKMLIEAEIVAGGGERRGVGGQRQRRDGRAVFFVADGEFGCEVLGIGGAAAIAEQHQLAAAADRGDASREQPGEGIGERGLRCPRDGIVLGEFGFEEFRPRSTASRSPKRPRRGIPAPRRAAHRRSLLRSLRASPCSSVASQARIDSSEGCTGFAATMPGMPISLVSSSRANRISCRRSPGRMPVNLISMSRPGSRPLRRMMRSARSTIFTGWPMLST